LPEENRSHHAAARGARYAIHECARRPGCTCRDERPGAMSFSPDFPGSPAAFFKNVEKMPYPDGRLALGFSPIWIRLPA